MSLKGLYTLRLVSTKNPDPGVGGMYATDNGETKQIILDPIEHPKLQTWYISPVEGEVDRYQILKVPGQRLGFMLKVAGVDLTAVVLNKLPERWRFAAVDDTTDVFTVHTYNEIPGVWTLLTNVKNGLAVDYFPLKEVMDVPAWKLEKLPV